jgi:hypothetical protein
MKKVLIEAELFLHLASSARRKWGGGRRERGRDREGEGERTHFESRERPGLLRS